MALRPVQVYSAQCDECGWVSIATDGEFMGFAATAAREAGWQVISHDRPSFIGSPLDIAYCPDHWHAECRECGRKETGTHASLLKAGWRSLSDNQTQALCPEHSTQERETWG